MILFRSKFLVCVEEWKDDIGRLEAENRENVCIILNFLLLYEKGQLQVFLIFSLALAVPLLYFTSLMNKTPNEARNFVYYKPAQICD